MKNPLTLKQKAGGAVLAVSAMLVGTVAMWEGTEYVPYRDIVGVLTVCQGYTGPGIVPGKVYTKAECDQLQGILVLQQVDVYRARRRRRPSGG